MMIAMIVFTLQTSLEIVVELVVSNKFVLASVLSPVPASPDTDHVGLPPVVFCEFYHSEL